MKIFYKKKLGEEIIEAKRVAEKNNKEIDYIELTDKEFLRLKAEIGLSDFFSLAKLKMFAGIEVRVTGEEIADEELIEAVKICRVGPVGINLHDIRILIKRLCNNATTYPSNVKEIPQEKRREFLDEVNKLLLASLKREAA